MRKTHYSCSELASLRLPGYPKTRQGWDAIVKSEGWPFIEVKSRGRMGTTREYEIPKELQQDIDAYAGMVKSEVTETGAPAAAVISDDLDHEGEFTTIDKYVNVKGAAGVGQEVIDEAVVQVRVDARLLRERIGNNINRVKIASVSGDSMEPTLSHGDQVLVDTSIDRFIENAIYAIQQNGHLRFKRINLRLDGSIVVKSDNDRGNTPETYTATEAEGIKVVGMVLPFKFGRFKI
jgi:phage repressor protein C with HTH and peptisase S24 domain